MLTKRFCNHCDKETAHDVERDESSMPVFDEENGDDDWSVSDHITYANGDYVYIETCLECGEQTETM